jgi:hypothetical protein
MRKLLGLKPKTDKELEEFIKEMYGDEREWKNVF